MTDPALRIQLPSAVAPAALCDVAERLAERRGWGEPVARTLVGMTVHAATMARQAESDAVECIVDVRDDHVRLRIIGHGDPNAADATELADAAATMPAPCATTVDGAEATIVIDL